jgi:uncharacterized coiled-coil DUF342 family protein
MSNRIDDLTKLRDKLKIRLTEIDLNIKALKREYRSLEKDLMQTNNQILLLRAAVSADRCIENINETY